MTGVAAGPAAADITRRALRQVTGGVSVLTVDRDGLRHGTTVSALVTISRQPLILGACLRPSSKFAALVPAGGLFSVNVLATGQEVLARRFADPARRVGDEQFAGLSWTADETTGAPLIGGCLAHLACRVTERQRIGDHELLLAEVVGGTPGTGLPLVSFAGRLHHGVPHHNDPTLSEVS
ncbi:flavin reductase [Sphaerisporangium rufum]|uniref:Flavin reductase n=1 Tax=Sphaerisporangium rufum TaxID=1381558 RepID=A0A919V3C8_9ACTN|nr:flavin reductase family protein [Sphaerisporangium rufum]GII76170.1 flavin reductase [Sphaerisporangium rufum]